MSGDIRHFILGSIHGLQWSSHDMHPRTIKYSSGAISSPETHSIGYAPCSCYPGMASAYRGYSHSQYLGFSICRASLYGSYGLP